MYFDTFADFIAMGTHGPYVWSAYGLTILVVVLNFMAIARQRKNTLATIRQKLVRQELARQQSEEDDAP